MIFAILTGCSSIVLGVGVCSGTDNNVRLAGGLMVGVLGAIYLAFEVLVIIRTFFIDMMGRKILTKTNEYRKSQGLRPLRWSQALCVVAMPHSKRMLSGKVPFGHDGFDKRVSGYTFKTSDAAENVAWNENADDVAKMTVDGWIDSEGHRKNMLGDYSYCGIGVAKKKGKYYITQLFAKKK